MRDVMTYEKTRLTPVKLKSLRKFNKPETNITRMSGWQISKFVFRKYERQLLYITVVVVLVLSISSNF